MEIYKSEKWLEQQYKEICHAHVVGRFCGVSGDTIEYWRNKLDIPKNSGRLKHARRYKI